VNPLVVRCRFSKLVDAILIDNGPLRDTDLLAFQRFRVVDRLDYVQCIFPKTYSFFAAAT
jgi:hypothetical protein